MRFTPSIFLLSLYLFAFYPFVFAAPKVSSKRTSALDWVETRTSISTARVGQKISVTCLPMDADDRVLKDITTKVVVIPDVGYLLKGKTLRFLRPGNWEVYCQAGSGKQIIRDKTPVPVEIYPGAPTKLVVDWSPIAIWYPINRPVVFKASLQDAFGNKIQDAHFSYQAFPKSGVDVASAPTFQFLKQGTFWVQISGWSPSDPKKKVLTEIIPIEVDGLGPKITLTYPKINEMIDGPELIQIHGKVSDVGSGVRSVKFNGKLLELSEKGEFEAWVPCEWGLNFISIQATDLAGNHSYVKRSFIYSTKYLSEKKNRNADAIDFASIEKLKLGALRDPDFFWNSPAVRQIVKEYFILVPVFFQGKSSRKEHALWKPVPAALRLFIHQKLLDDGKRMSPNDLTTILEHAINAFDPDKVIPKRLAKGAYKIPPFGPTVAYEVHKIGRLKMGRSKVKLRLSHQQLRISIKLSNIYLPLKIKYGKSVQKPTVQASKMSVEITFRIFPKAGRMHFKVLKISADLSSLSISNLKGVAWALKPIINRIVRSRVKKEATKLLMKKIAPLVQSVLQGASLDRRWTLPAQLGRPYLRTFSKLEAVQIRPKGLSISLNGAVSASFPQSKYLRKGPVLFPVKKVPMKESSVSLAISVNLLNQFLYALWASGALHQDFSKILKKRLPMSKLPFPLETPELRIHASLPPILMPGNKKYPLALALGNFSIQIVLPGPSKKKVNIQAYTSVVLGFRLERKGSEAFFRVAPQPLKLQIQIAELSGLPRLLSSQLSAFLEGLVREVMSGFGMRLVRQLPIKIPKLPKKARPYLPSLASIKIQPPEFAFRGSYLMFSIQVK